MHVFEVNEDNLPRLLEDTKKSTRDDIEWPIFYFRGEFIGVCRLITKYKLMNINRFLLDCSPIFRLDSMCKK